MKNKQILNSIITILLCLSLISGSTFAIFTHEDAVSTTVTNGNVDIRAGIIPGSLVTYSVRPLQNGGYVELLNETSTFLNGGTATLFGDAREIDILEKEIGSIRDTEMVQSYAANIGSEYIAIDTAMQGVNIINEVLFLMKQHAQSDEDLEKYCTQVDYVVANTKYNGVALFDGTYSENGFSFQVGTQSMTVTFPDLTAKGLGLSNDSTTAEVDDAIMQVISCIADIGSVRNRLEHTSPQQLSDGDTSIELYRLDKANPDVSTGISMLLVMRIGIGDILETLTLMKTLDSQGEEWSHMRMGINNIAKSVIFNNLLLLDGTCEDIVIQTGPTHGEALTVNIPSLMAEDIGLTSESTVNDIDLAISKVTEVNDRIKNQYLPALYEVLGEEADEFDETSYGCNALQLNAMSPGDKVEFMIKVANRSDVKMKLRIRWGITGELADVLEVNVRDADGNNISPFTANSSDQSSYTTWTAYDPIAESGDQIITYFYVSVKMQLDAENIYADKLCKILFQAEAVQSNADTSVAKQSYAVYSESDQSLRIFNRSTVYNKGDELDDGATVTSIYPIESTVSAMKQSPAQASVIDHLVNLSRYAEVGSDMYNTLMLDTVDAIRINSSELTVTEYGAQETARALRINSAADNTAGMAVAIRLRLQLESKIFRSSMLSSVPWKDQIIKKVIFEDGINAPYAQNWFENQTELESVEFGESFDGEIISYGMFKNCTALRSIVLPNSVKTVEMSAFSGCTSLESVTFGNGLEYISIAAFAGCSALTNVEFPASLLMIGEYAFYEAGLVSASIDRTEGQWQQIDTLIHLPAACGDASRMDWVLWGVDDPVDMNSADFAESLTTTAVGKGWCEHAFYIEQERIVLGDSILMAN